MPSVVQAIHRATKFNGWQLLLQKLHIWMFENSLASNYSSI